MLEVKTAGKLGYCFGVSQAIEKAISFAEENGPIYTLGTLAHNEAVVELLREHGIEPISMEEVLPVGTEVHATQTTIAVGMNVAITAHGAPPATFQELEDSGCTILDCTCPIVSKAQAVVNCQLDDFDIVIFGDPGHQEVIGLDGWARGAKFVGTSHDLFTASQGHKRLNLRKKVGVISQTTQIPPLFVDFVTTLANHHLGRFQELRVFNTICPIVAARAKETNKLSTRVDMMLVVGSQESANTKNLASVAKPVLGAGNVLIIQNADQVKQAMGDWWVQAGGAERSGMELGFRIGVTAGTSTPIEVVDQVVQQVREMFHAG